MFSKLWSSFRLTREKRSFVHNHLCKIRSLPLREILNFKLYREVLLDSLPTNSQSFNLLKCIMFCDDVLIQNRLESMVWDAFFACIPSSTWKLLLLFEYRRFLSDPKPNSLLTRIIHLRSYCLKNLEVDYDYIIFQSEIRNSSRRCKRILKKLYSINIQTSDVHKL